MRVKGNFLYKKLKLCGLISALCLGGAFLAYLGFNIFAAPMEDEARVNENEPLTYYITVNSDGIDHKGITSSDSQLSDEVSGTTKITDRLPDGLTFEGFVTSPDGTFGAVQRDDQTTMCGGRVIDDTNEESIEAGSWNSDHSEFTYHGLHYDAPTRTVSFRTKGIGAGCELTVGVVTRTPTLPEGVFRMDFYDHASFVDESLFGDSNTVHAWIQKDALPDEFWLSYRYEGEVPDGAPAVPATTFYSSANADITVADLPTMDGYTFDGWYYYNGNYEPRKSAANLTNLMGRSMELFGSWTKDGEPVEPEDDDPVKYDVVYEVEGEKPVSFNVPAKRSYYEGASVEVDSAKEGDNYDGYDFSGWDTNDVDLDDGEVFEMPSRKVTLRGSFEQETYTVSYEFIGDVKPENAESLLPETTEHLAGDMVTVAPVPTASGYTFSGWYASASFEMPANNIVIQGEWTKNKQTYAPDLSIEITNPQDEYRKGETVHFKVTVTNDSVVDLNNVWLEELLEGAVFVDGDNYSVEQATFAKVDSIPAGESAVVFAEYPVTKNVQDIYTNTVELITLEFGSEDYALPDDWDNRASVDFATVVIPDEPIDPKDEPEEDNAKTYDGLGKMILSGAILGGGLAACVVLAKRVRRGGIVYGYFAAIMSVSGLAVVCISGGLSFADNLVEKPEVKIYSSNLSFENHDPGAWVVRESARWTGVGEATLTYDVSSVKISDLHNKDVVLILDNSNWSNYALDGTEPDGDMKRALEIMKEGATDLVEDLLADGDSRVVILPTWGSNDGVLTNNIETAQSQIDAISSASNTNYSAYSTTYDKILEFLDTYEQSSNRALNIVYVSDDHIARSNEIAKYKMVKAKAPNAIVSGIGIGVLELMHDRYVSPSAASANGVVRYWVDEEGQLAPGGRYTGAANGLELLSDYHANPWGSNYAAELVKSIDTSLIYSKFNIAAGIDLTDFSIVGIYGEVGDFDVDGGTVTWTNEDKGLVSGKNYSMSVVLRAKDETVAKHKLYQLNTETSVETDASDIAADTVTSNEHVVLMNGYELTFDINNPSTCSLGENEDGHIFLAFQKMNLDEEGVSCEGWNFDSFKNESEGLIYGAKNDKMPANDFEIKATWRKVDAEVHMDGTVHTVAPAVLMDGVSFNLKMQQISNDYNLVLKADGCPQAYMDEAHRISDSESPTSIYAWKRAGSSSYPYIDYDKEDEDEYYSYVVYYCTDADEIQLNEDSSFMFANSYTYEDDEGNRSYLNSYSRMYDKSIADWDASHVKNMEGMFYNNKNIGMVTLGYMGDWDTSSVENLDYFLYDTEIENNNPRMFANWDTSKVTSMKYAFASTSKIEYLTGIGDWDVSNVTDMEGVFQGIEYTQNVDMLVGWDTSKVENMKNIFSGAYNDSRREVELDLSGISGWTISNVKDLSNAFYYVNLDLNKLSSWDISNVEDLSEIFSSATIKSGEIANSANGVRNWDVSKVTNASGMFSKTKVSDISGLAAWGQKTKNIQNYNDMFKGNDLTSLDGLETWDTSGATTMRYMFSDSDPNSTANYAHGSYITDIDAVSGWNVSNVTDLTGTFAGIIPDDLTALANWDVSKVESLAYTFCGSLQHVENSVYRTCKDISDYGVIYKNTGYAENPRSAYGGPASLSGLESWATKVGHVKTMEGMLSGGRIANLTPLANWDVSSVEDLSSTFAVTNVNSFSALSNWNTSSLKNLKWTFMGTKATNLSGLDGDNWLVGNVTSMVGTFANMSELENIEALASWEPSDALTNMTRTFYLHKKLASLHGLENWNVSRVSTFDLTFAGYNQYAYPSASSSSHIANWGTYANSQLTDISALSNWYIKENATNLNGFLANNNRLVDITPLSGVRAHKVTLMSRIFEGDRSITTLSALEHWYDDLGTPENITRVTIDYAFAYMYGLTDISALNTWTGGNNKVQTYSMRGLMRGDYNIASGSAKTYLENAYFKTLCGIWGKNDRLNAFESVPGNLPSWYTF